jgi:hypothetical protein
MSRRVAVGLAVATGAAALAFGFKVSAQASVQQRARAAYIRDRHRFLHSRAGESISYAAELRAWHKAYGCSDELDPRAPLVVGEPIDQLAAWLRRGRPAGYRPEAN